MPAYTYRARDMQSRVVQGNLDAADEREAVQQLRSRGLIPVQLAVAKAATPADPAATPVRQFRLFLPKVKLKTLAYFCRVFATMIGAGLSILISLRTIANQSGDRALSGILLDVAGRLEGGESLSQAFLQHVPPLPAIMVHMIQAGEVGGVLEDAFRRLALQFEKENALNEKVRSALVYPKFVITAAIGLVVFLLVYILPTFEWLLSQFDTELPIATKIVMWTGGFVRANLYALVLGAAGLFAAFKLYPKTSHGKERMAALSLQVPVLGQLNLKRSMARCTRTLATLLESGVPILTALRVAEHTLDNPVLENALRKARENVRAGRTLADPLREDKWFPPMLVAMVAAGEQTGALDSMLFKAADFYEQETEQQVASLTSVIEPIIVVGLAGVVGVVVASVFLPLYQVLGSVK